jgi:hypothetical protein
MSSKAKYNVLMMRDNTPVRRYRFPRSGSTGAYFLLVLLAVAGAGGYFGLTFWKENRVLRGTRPPRNVNCANCTSSWSG